MDDNAILDLFIQRDENAIHETQRKYAGYLFTVASNILPSTEDAEECVNDAYFKAWVSIPPKRPAFFKSYLAKITRNCSLDKYRGNNAKKRAGGQMDLLLSELTEAIPSGEDVYATVESFLTTEEINNFLWNLDKDTRLVFMRRYWYADSISAISKGFLMGESKVKHILMRTRRKLKAHLLRGNLA